VTRRLSSVARLLSLASTALLAACAFGHTIDYGSVDPKVSWRGSGPVTLAVQDQRSEILKQERRTNWVGNNRDSYGRPFNVTTADKEPLAADFAKVVGRGLQSAGFAVSTLAVEPDATDASIAVLLAARGAPRAIVLKITTWKSDSTDTTTIRYGFFARVTDGQGQLLGQATQLGSSLVEEDISDAQEGLALVYAHVINGLLSDPSLIRAMQPGATPLPPRVSRATP